MQSDQATMAYIGRRDCGCVVAVVVDAPNCKRDTARDVVGCIREGLTVERVPIETLCALALGCVHRKAEERQGEMAL